MKKDKSKDSFVRLKKIMDDLRIASREIDHCIEENNKALEALGIEKSGS